MNEISELYKLLISKRNTEKQTPKMVQNQDWQENLSQDITEKCKIQDHTLDSHHFIGDYSLSEFDENKDESENEIDGQNENNPFALTLCEPRECSFSRFVETFSFFWVSKSEFEYWILITEHFLLFFWIPWESTIIEYFLHIFWFLASV